MQGRSGRDAGGRALSRCLTSGRRATPATPHARRHLLSASVACLLLVPALHTCVDSAAAAPQATALAVTASGAPLHVRGSDGREYIEYDLVITNAFTADLTLRSIEVLGKRGKRGDWRRLLRLEGDALADATHELSQPPPTATVPRSGTVATVVSLTVPKRALPTRLTHRVAYDVPPDAPSQSQIGSRQVNGPKLRMGREPTAIAPPLRGDGWFEINACCDPSGHREALFPANGRFVKVDLFAMDWVRLRDGRLYEGDGSQLDQWYGEGTPLRAVADGKVVRAVDGRPEHLPAPFGMPHVTRPDEFNGNYVILRIRRGVYAFYAHMIPGTVRVTVGQRVHTGEVLGELGMSGQTTAPHLHFDLQDGPDPQTSNSLPFELDWFRIVGTGALVPSGIGDGVKAEVPVTGSPGRLRHAYPLSNSVVDFRAHAAGEQR